MNLKRYKVIDAHCDTIYELMCRGGTLRQNNLCVSLPKLQPYGGYIQFFAVWLDDASPSPLDEAMQMIDIYHRELSANRETILPILTRADFETVLATGQIGAMLTVENGSALAGQRTNVYQLYALGVRALTLTWNGTNELCDGIVTDRGAGLSVFGREVVCEMNRLGMMIDVSHLSEQGFWDVLEESEKPVMASHSNSRAIADHPRNLSDEQIRALAEKGGVIGLNLYPAFLRLQGEAGLEDCLRHIRHIIQVGGESCVCLGSDFDGFSGHMPQGLHGPDDYWRLFEKMERSGFSEDIIHKITHKNMLIFAKNTLK